MKYFKSKNVAKSWFCKIKDLDKSGNSELIELYFFFKKNFDDRRVWLWQFFFADTWDLKKFSKPVKNRFFHVMLFRRFTKFWIIWATLYFFENFNRKNNIVLTVEHIVTNFFFRKGQGIKVWLLLYPLRLSNPHSMQIWDCTNLSVLEPCFSSAASRSELVQQCVGILFLNLDCYLHSFIFTLFLAIPFFSWSPFTCTSTILVIVHNWLTN